MPPPATTKLMTAEGFYEFAHRPENVGRSLELDRGEVVELSRATKLHGIVAATVTTILSNVAAQRGRGYVCSNGSGLIVERNPDTVRGPDVAYYEDDQTFETMDPMYSESPPSLIAEVLSPGDQISHVNRRISQYLKCGVTLVWLVDPEVRAVTVYPPGKLLQVFFETDDVAGNDVLPGFTCQVAEFFALPGQAARPPVRPLPAQRESNRT